jgi:hypothetical protein
MINKIADSHFNTLRAASASSVKSDATRTPSSAHDALDMFLSTPSFSGKQNAIESLLRQITQGTGTSPSKTGALG